MTGPSSSKSKRLLAASLAGAVAVLIGLVGCKGGGEESTPTLYALPSLEASLMPSATLAQALPTDTAVPSPVPTLPDYSWCSLDAAFVADLTVPDYTTIEPATLFTKSWRMQNTSTCDWGPGFELLFYWGDQLVGPVAVEVPETAQGEMVDISVDLQAPLEIGEYTMVWQLVSPDGTWFGTEPYLRIVVPWTVTVTPTPTSPEECVYNVAFVDDVTIPDNMQILAGAEFTKVWRMINTSTCHWGEGFDLVFISGDPLGADESNPIPEVKMGEQFDILVDMRAPEEGGLYRSIWKIQKPDGTQFGLEPFVRIEVVEPTRTPTPEATDTPTPTVGPGTPSPTPQPTQRPTRTPTAGPTPTARPVATAAPPASHPGYPALVTGITAHSRQIYLNGQTLGNKSTVFSKVGDSITHSPAFLNPIGQGRTDLHEEYAYLQPAINWFMGTARVANSFDNPSLAERYGWTSADILNPASAEPGCAGRSPLVCEYELSHPSVALIMIGTNDSTGHLSVDAFRANLQQIVDISLEYGVIPVLYTIPWNAYGDVSGLNNVIVSTAWVYDVPLIDYYSAMEALPNHGVSDDGVHPSLPPDGNTANFSEENVQYGYTLRNLISVQALDAIWRQVIY
ncbi:MAG: hypothetical protein JXJ17_04720 [Anaerolineae bacterium]|nr:hypothetical protein [Anaerolineae bacterium]